ncbi:putative membrane protein C20F10,07 [Schizosaccharomyces pombe 972h-] [Rhizoctonia solani]|uniref:Putative membrane protein C20F10,07 [Schizosaccharomyces pombe 972h-] n=1 Tax=Rhizoctonia solani TaxID=456999 RepID=A0A0K6G707_9AGAM|nr:putative membrane protein C20F10,07 [Schizosaccharomyces pombe 972h-] [Rhizoctonia solani]
MSTEVLSPARANSRASVLDPLLSKSTLTIPETRPREGSVASNSASSVRSVSSRPESVASRSQNDSYEYDAAPQAPPIPGFVVASSKRNADFHELFPNVPEGDYLVQDYGCAWHREIMIQGRLYISENHLCFYANIFGWITSVTLPFLDVSAIEKRMTAYVIPNAILINTFGGTEYTFASFLTRDTVYDLMQSLWRPSQPAAGQIEGNNKDDSGEAEVVGEDDAAGSTDSPTGHKPTECACGKNGEHYATIVADYKLPGTPEKIYGLMFKDPFLLDFMKNNQKLIDVQISEWTPKEPDSPLVAREMSFIKPLSGGLGPKQTKCEIKDEVVHSDFDDYVSVLTTTRTPDVPSGSVFSVKTRVCLTWAGAASTRCVVTSTVEWTGRSFIKAVIDRSAIDGQKQHHQDLEKAMRKHIAAHRSEFIPQGAAIQEAEATNGAITPDETLEVKSQTSSPTQETSQIAAILQLIRQLAQDAFTQIKEIPSTHALGLLVLVLALSNIWSLLRPIPEPRIPGDAQALKARAKAEKKGRIDVRVEIRELRRSMEMIEKRLERIEASLGDLD